MVRWKTKSDRELQCQPRLRDIHRSVNRQSSLKYPNRDSFIVNTNVAIPR